MWYAFVLIIFIFMAYTVFEDSTTINNNDLEEIGELPIEPI